MGEKRNAYRILVRKQESKRVRKTKLMWVDTFKMDFRDIAWVEMDRIDLAQDRDHCRVLMNTVMNLVVL
jgi:hypothetical protein